MFNEHGEAVRQHSGEVRVGRGLAESTFRKIYHALQTLHVHFQQDTEYKVGCANTLE